MSQMFDEKGNVIPVTLIEAGPCFVTQKKGLEKDKYEAIQIGFGKLKESKITKSAKNKPYRNVKEFRGRNKGSNDPKKFGGAEYESLNVGDEIKVSIFAEGEKVTVIGTSKGKGFQGVIKRHGFGGKPHTHGMKHEERGMGSMASGMPNRGRVAPGLKMPGRMGYERTAMTNLKVIKADPENNLLVVKGAIPGKRGTILEITS